MSLRQKINGNPAVIAAFAVVLIGITGWFSFKSIRGSGAPYIPTQAYFSSDDGKTWFADDKKKAPPFKAADGKDAVQAVVVSCKGGKDPFVMYLWRYTADAKSKLDEAAASGDPAKLGAAETAVSMSREMKKPGQSEWIRMTDFKNSPSVMAMVCPPGEEDLVILDP